MYTYVSILRILNVRDEDPSTPHVHTQHAQHTLVCRRGRHAPAASIGTKVLYARTLPYISRVYFFFEREVVLLVCVCVYT